VLGTVVRAADHRSGHLPGWRDSTPGSPHSKRPPTGRPPRRLRSPCRSLRRGRPGCSYGRSPPRRRERTGAPARDGGTRAGAPRGAPCGTDRRALRRSPCRGEGTKGDAATTMRHGDRKAQVRHGWIPPVRRPSGVSSARRAWLCSGRAGRPPADAVIMPSYPQAGLVADREQERPARWRRRLSHQIPAAAAAGARARARAESHPTTAAARRQGRRS
jgi:hypothetical protein